MSLPFDPFEEMATSQKDHCRNGLTFADLGQSCYNVFSSVQGKPPTPLQEADRVPWEMVAGKAASIFDLPESEQATLEINAKQLAKTLYNQYQVECDKYPDWESQTTRDALAWEAVGRHLANTIDADGIAVDFSDYEERIVEWAEAKLNQTQLTLS